MKRWLILLMLVWWVPECPAASAADKVPARWLYLNLPSRTMVFYENGNIAARYSVAIGKPSDPTPLGHYSIQNVIFNPNWYNGNDAAVQRRVPPGPNNPMGQAKINFSKNYYIHGTPHPWSVGLAVSHGCLRMENRDVLDLAQRLMADNAPVDFDEIKATLAASPPEPREITLDRTIPLVIDYQLLTLGAKEGTIWPDIYGRFPHPLQIIRSQLQQAARQQGRTLELPPQLLDELAHPVQRRIDFDLVLP